MLLVVRVVSGEENTCSTSRDAHVGENVGVSLLAHVLPVVKAGSKRVGSAVL